MIRFALIIALILTVGCKDDEFANAPTVKATPGESGPVKPEGPAGMPANHPPTGGGKPSPSQAPAGFGSSVKFAGVAEYGKTGPLLWTAPSGWTAVKSASSMRLAEYVVPGVEGLEPGTVSIFHFGASGGGGVEANVSRWVGQFKSPAGKPAVQRETKTINTMNVHLVQVEGTFSAGMAGNGQTKDNYKMRGAIVESPGGLFFFKLVGPKASVDARTADFDAFVASFKPGI